MNEFQQEAHALLYKQIDRLDTTERRLAHGDVAQALCNLYALRISLDTVVDLLTGAVGLARRTPTVVECVQMKTKLNIYQRADGSLYLAIPRRDGHEQYGISYEDVEHLAEECKTFLESRP